MTDAGKTPEIGSRTMLTLANGDVVKLLELHYTVGRTPNGLAYRVTYRDGEVVRGCKADVVDGSWRQVAGSLVR